jgi:hypothetical protein
VAPPAQMLLHCILFPPSRASHADEALGREAAARRAAEGEAAAQRHLVQQVVACERASVCAGLRLSCVGRGGLERLAVTCLQKAEAGLVFTVPLIALTAACLDRHAAAGRELFRAALRCCARHAWATTAGFKARSVTTGHAGAFCPPCPPPHPHLRFCRCRTKQCLPPSCSGRGSSKGALRGPLLPPPCGHQAQLPCAQLPPPAPCFPPRCLRPARLPQRLPRLICSWPEGRPPAPPHRPHCCLRQRHSSHQRIRSLPCAGLRSTLLLTQAVRTGGRMPSGSAPVLPLLLLLLLFQVQRQQAVLVG